MEKLQREVSRRAQPQDPQVPGPESGQTVKGCAMALGFRQGSQSLRA